MNADQSISFDICEENSECLFFLQSEMRRQGITQGDIDRARKSEEAKILADAQGAKGKGEDLNAKDNIGACLVGLFNQNYRKTIKTLYSNAGSWSL